MFYDTFVKLCEQADKSPSRVLGELGISTGSLGRWRNGVMPGAESLIALADYFGCTTDYLLGRTDDPNIAIKKIPSERGEITLGIAKEHEDEEITAEEVFAVVDRFEGMTKEDVLALIRQVANEEIDKRKEDL